MHLAGKLLELCKQRVLKNVDANARAGCREQGFIGVANVAAVVPLEYPIAAVFRGLHANVIPLTVTVPSICASCDHEGSSSSNPAFFGSFGKVPGDARSD